MATDLEVNRRKLATQLSEKWGEKMLEMCIIDTGNGKGPRCLLLPRDICVHLVQEDTDYWQGGDFSLLEVLYPDWYDFIIRELGLKG